MSSLDPSVTDTRARALGLGLFLVLVCAKLTMAAAVVALGRPWSLVALCWQDIGTAIVVTGVFRLAPRRWMAMVLYSALVAYIALNVPVARVLGSPLTWTMWRAAGGALGDSIHYHLTGTNLGLLTAFLAFGGVTPIVGAKWPRSRTAFFAALVVMALGPLSASHVETLGFDRNAFTVLLPRLSEHRLAAPGSAPGLARSGSLAQDAEFKVPDLRAYRGSALGMNVVLVVLESTAADYLAAYGATRDPMPTLTTLGRHALIGDRAYAAYPESVKGLYATLCGEHPRFRQTAEAHAALPCASIAASLKRAGYRTALFHSGRFNYLGMDALIRDKGFDVTEDAGLIGGDVESSFGVPEAATVTSLLSWVDRGTTGEPFFAAYLPVAGHHPYASATGGPFETTSEFGRYQNALHDADTALRTLLDGLLARGLSDRTALVIIADHGEAFGQHPGNSGHTLFIYDENVRVPFVVSIPGMNAGQRTPSVASLVDVPATIRDLTGLEAADDDGISLLSPAPRMAFFFTDYALGWIGLRDGCRKYIEEVGTRRSKLFDLCVDPEERHDLSQSVPEATGAYQRRIESLLPD